MITERETERQSEIRKTVADLDRMIVEMYDERLEVARRQREAAQPFAERDKEIGDELHELHETRDELCREFYREHSSAMTFAVGESIEYYVRARSEVLLLPCLILMTLAKELVIQPPGGEPFVIDKTEVTDRTLRLPTCPAWPGDDDAGVPF